MLDELEVTLQRKGRVRARAMKWRDEVSET
jgi:hypothetical protein